MLMRYQAALRSDRGDSRRDEDNSRPQPAAQPAGTANGFLVNRNFFRERPLFPRNLALRSDLPLTKICRSVNGLTPSTPSRSHTAQRGRIDIAVANAT
jgi:hypothetical protein